MRWSSFDDSLECSDATAAFRFQMLQLSSQLCRSLIVRASVKLFELGVGYVSQEVYFWAYGTPGVSIFGVFVRVTNCPGMPRTVTESRVCVPRSGRSNPGQLSVQE